MVRSKESARYNKEDLSVEA